jgi:hypothetical protein
VGKESSHKQKGLDLALWGQELWPSLSFLPVGSSHGQGVLVARSPTFEKAIEPSGKPSTLCEGIIPLTWLAVRSPVS